MQKKSTDTDDLYDESDELSLIITKQWAIDFEIDWNNNWKHVMRLYKKQHSQNIIEINKDIMKYKKIAIIEIAKDVIPKIAYEPNIVDVLKKEISNKSHSDVILNHEKIKLINNKIVSAKNYSNQKYKKQYTDILNKQSDDLLITKIIIPNTPYENHIVDVIKKLIQIKLYLTIKVDDEYSIKIDEEIKYLQEYVLTMNLDIHLDPIEK